jgi:hypothetical protein
MFNGKFVIETIKEYIDKGIENFVIYPYGLNGLNVKKILWEYFDIEPRLIVDNEYANYNKNIVNGETLKQSFNNDMYIIISAEDRQLNQKIESSICDFVPKNNIINLLKLQIGENREITNQFSIDYFLPDIKKDSHIDIKPVARNGKIKVRILHSVYAFWNSMETICEAFREDEQYDLLVILGDHEGDYDLREKQMQEKGYKYICWNEYDAKTDSADILILTHLWEDTKIPECRKYTKLIVVASMSLIRYGYSNNDFLYASRIGFEKYYPDYYLFDSMVFNQIKDSGFFKGRAVEFGNAKFDGIYEACKQKEYPGSWGKLKGKKTILWAVDHGINVGNYVNTIRDEVTFDLYARYIFQYAKDNKNIGLIFRPHPAFIYELKGLGYWTDNDLLLLRQYCDESENIIFDENETYNEAYSVSDAILTDALSGVTCSALPTLKPICALYRNDKKIKAFAGDLVKNYYSARSVNELKEFLDMVENNKDPMYDQRKKASEKYVKHFDGKNGMRIKQFIEGKFKETYDCQ